MSVFARGNNALEPVRDDIMPPGHLGAMMGSINQVNFLRASNAHAERERQVQHVGFPNRIAPLRPSPVPEPNLPATQTVSYGCG